MRILLVEDDLELGPLTAEVLAQLGHEAALVASIDDGFERVVAGPAFDAILLDLQIGRHRGEMIVRRLRKVQREVAPLILFSALPIDELRRSAVELGAAAILQKPATRAQLIDALARASATRK